MEKLQLSGAGGLSLEPAARGQNRAGQVVPEALEKWGWERRLDCLGKEEIHEHVDLDHTQLLS